MDNAKRKQAAAKAKVTLERNRIARERERNKSDVERERDANRIKEAMRQVLDDPDTTPQQKLDAVAILDNLTGFGFVPYSVRQRYAEQTEHSQGEE